jgi:hypothetical protein
MNALSQLKQIRQQMFEELSKTPEYRAAQAMKKFIDEMAEIQGGNAPSAGSAGTKTIERRIAEGPATDGVSQRIRAYSP